MPPYFSTVPLPFQKCNVRVNLTSASAPRFRSTVPEPNFRNEHSSSSGRQILYYGTLLATNKDRAEREIPFIIHHRGATYKWKKVIYRWLLMFDLLESCGDNFK